MGKQFFRFFSESLLAFENRIQHQTGNRTVAKLEFLAAGIECCFYDALLADPGGVTLHRGVGIDVYAQSEDDHQISPKPFCERLLGLLSYSHMSPCHPARLEMSYDAAAGKQDRGFTFTRMPSAVQTAVLRTVDPELFRAVSETQHFDDDPKWLALEWFRKGLTEHFVLNEFIAYWSALELVKGRLRQILPSIDERSYPHCPVCSERIAVCPKCKGDSGTVSPWSGLFRLMDQGIGVERQAFQAVRKLRGGMLHGGVELSDKAVDRIRDHELPILRRIVIYALAAVFQIPFDIAGRIAGMSVHKIVMPITTKLSGTLELSAGEPPPLERIELQPAIRARVVAERHGLNDEGRLSVSFDVDYQTSGATYQISRSELWTDSRAGASGGSVTINS